MRQEKKNQRAEKLVAVYFFAIYLLSLDNGEIRTVC